MSCSTRFAQPTGAGTGGSEGGSEGDSKRLNYMPQGDLKSMILFAVEEQTSRVLSGLARLEASLKAPTDAFQRGVYMEAPSAGDWRQALQAELAGAVAELKSSFRQELQELQDSSGKPAPLVVPTASSLAQTMTAFGSTIAGQWGPPSSDGKATVDEDRAENLRAAADAPRKDSKELQKVQKSPRPTRGTVKIDQSQDEVHSWNKDHFDSMEDIQNCKGMAETPSQRESRVLKGRTMMSAWKADRPHKKNQESDAGKRTTRRSSRHVAEQATMQARLDATRRTTFTQFREQYRETGSMPGVRAHLDWLVRNDYFNYGMGVILLANALMMGVQADYFAKTGDEKIPLFFRISDSFFCIVFFLEASVRFIAFGPKEFVIGEQWRWNFFDSFIVTLQVMDEIVKLWLRGTPVQEAMNNIGIIRMLRLGKLARLVRMVRLIPELKSMVYLIFASIGSFFWSMILIVMMMYVFAIYYTEMVTDLIATEKANMDPETHDALKGYWGTLSLSVLSLWMAITGGDDWHNFIDILKIDKVYVMHSLFFVTYIAFGTLVMLNLVTGVFVEGAQRIIKEDKDNELLALAAKMFQEAGCSCQGITIDDFNERLMNGTMDEYIEAIGINMLEAEHLFEALDRDRSGQISLLEFVHGCLRLRGSARSVDVSEMSFRMRDYFIVVEQNQHLLAGMMRDHASATEAKLKDMSKLLASSVKEGQSKVARDILPMLLSANPEYERPRGMFAMLPGQLLNEEDEDLV